MLAFLIVSHKQIPSTTHVKSLSDLQLCDNMPNLGNTGIITVYEPNEGHITVWSRTKCKIKYYYS